MSGVAPPPAAATPAKSPKRKATKAKKTGPTVSDQILKVVAASKERGGVSLPALKKSLAAGGYDVAANRARVLAAVRRLVARGGLQQVKGTGASGSFKINQKQPADKKKTRVVVKKTKKKKKAAKTPAAKEEKAVSATPKKPTGAAKKSPKRKRRSPKKAQKPAAKKVTKSPRMKTKCKLSRCPAIAKCPAIRK